MRYVRLALTLALITVPALAQGADSFRWANPDAEIRYVPPRRVIAPPFYGEPGPVIFPKQLLPDGTTCSPPYDFCQAGPEDWVW